MRSKPTSFFFVYLVLLFCQPILQRCTQKSKCRALPKNLVDQEMQQDTLSGASKVM